MPHNRALLLVRVVGVLAIWSTFCFGIAIEAQTAESPCVPVGAFEDNRLVLEDLQRSVIVDLEIRESSVEVVSSFVAFVAAQPRREIELESLKFFPMSGDFELSPSIVVPREEVVTVEDVGAIRPRTRRVTIAVPLFESDPPVDRLELESGFLPSLIDLRPAVREFCRAKRDDAWCSKIVVD